MHCMKKFYAVYEKNLRNVRKKIYTSKRRNHYCRNHYRHKMAGGAFAFEDTDFIF